MTIAVMFEGQRERNLFPTGLVLECSQQPGVGVAMQGAKNSLSGSLEGGRAPNKPSSISSQSPN